MRSKSPADPPAAETGAQQPGWTAATGDAASHPHLPLMLRNLRVGFFDVSPVDGPCWHCDRYLALLGYGPADRAQFAAGFRPLIHPEDVPALLARQQRRASGQPTRIAVQARVMRRDGSWLWVRWIGVISERDAQGRPSRIVGTMESIETSKRREAALVEASDGLSALIEHANDEVEEERKRLAGEVHDQLGQMLTLLRLELDQLVAKAGRRQAMREVLDRLRGHVDMAIQASRRIALRMRPALLDFGLVPALSWLAEDFNTRAGFSCTFSHDPGAESTLSEAVATALFRIAQEAVSNAGRHAGPCRTHISLDRTGQALKLVVSDDGCGFEPAAAGARARLGLSGMRERALRAGASWSLHSSPGQGTRVEVLLPLA